MNAPAVDRKRGRGADVACVAALIACQAWAALSVVFVTGWIGTRPVALEAVNGSILSVVAAGAFARVGRAGVAAALVAPLPLWLPVDMASWWAGWHFGPRMATWLVRRRPSSETVVARCERLIDRHRVVAVALAPWLPVPAAVLYAASGWRRLPLPLFVVADATGTLARNSVVLMVGFTVGAHGVSVAQRISEFASWVTGALVVAVLGVLSVRALQLWRSRERGASCKSVGTCALNRSGREGAPTEGE
jgi:membrane protein DedA with SNARE-associated domain